MGQSRGSGALTLRYEVNFILLFSAPWVLRMRFITQSQIRHRLDASQSHRQRGCDDWAGHTQRFLLAVVFRLVQRLVQSFFLSDPVLFME